MITPQDIQDAVFDKAVRGYNPDQVDTFLDELTTDLQTLMDEKDDLAAQLEAANAKLDEYKNQESAVIKTLESARALMNDISASAEKRADIIMKNAELDADQLLRTAKDNVEKLREEEKDLTQRVSSIKNRIRNILTSELDRFDKVDTDIFGGIVSPSALSGVNTAEAPSAEDQFDSLTKVDIEPVMDIFSDLSATKIIKKEE